MCAKGRHSTQRSVNSTHRRTSAYTYTAVRFRSEQMRYSKGAGFARACTEKRRSSNPKRGMPMLQSAHCSRIIVRSAGSTPSLSARSSDGEGRRNSFTTDLPVWTYLALYRFANPAKVADIAISVRMASTSWPPLLCSLAVCTGRCAARGLDHLDVAGRQYLVCILPSPLFFIFGSALLFIRGALCSFSVSYHHVFRG